MHSSIQFHSVFTSISIHIGTRTYAPYGVYDEVQIGVLHLYGMPLEQVN